MLKTAENDGKRWKGDFDQRPDAGVVNLLIYQVYMGTGGKVWESNPPGTFIAPYWI